MKVKMEVKVKVKMKNEGGKRRALGGSGCLAVSIWHGWVCRPLYWFVVLFVTVSLYGWVCQPLFGYVFVTVCQALLTISL
jgi:hypothetical protein